MRARLTEFDPPRGGFPPLLQVDLGAEGPRERGSRCGEFVFADAGLVVPDEPLRQSQTGSLLNVLWTPESSWVLTRPAPAARSPGIYFAEFENALVPGTTALLTPTENGAIFDRRVLGLVATLHQVSECENHGASGT